MIRVCGPAPFHVKRETPNEAGLAALPRGPANISGKHPMSPHDRDTTDHAHGEGTGKLALGALGVVFGDIGTSPLYALKESFVGHHPLVVDQPHVFGVLSLIFWTMMLIVTVKYVFVILRADNGGEGGSLALLALVADRVGTRKWTPGIVMLGILATALFYGDAIITPAISVLSAVEGLTVIEPGLGDLVLPLSVAILVGLFAIQSHGTARVGALFGPVMVVYFAVLALLGVTNIVAQPGIIAALNPWYALQFFLLDFRLAFLALGSVVLAVTGAEALYADMGHFGRKSISIAWLYVALPCLMLNYLGQGALLIGHPQAAENPFFLMAPDAYRLPLVVLATVATVIASQAVISGAFSLSRQAVRLGLLPPLTVRQTSEREGGQVYLPAVNVILFAGVLLVMLSFRSSARLATAYGVSVTGALVVDTVLLLLVARVAWRWRPWQMVLFAVPVGGLELVFLSGNLSKVAHGGWLPLLIALVVLTVMTTWRRGREIVSGNRRAKEGPLDEFCDALYADGITRVPGTAVFPHPDKTTTPLALRANVEHNHVLHERVIIVSSSAANVPHVPPDQRFSVDDLGHADDGVQHVAVRFGFSDAPDLPAALREAAETGLLGPSTAVDVDTASFFVSRGAIRLTRAPGMARWRKALFVALALGAADPSAYFHLPPRQTVTMGSDVDV